MYSAAVVDPKKLRNYKSFSAEVYGEANFGLVNHIIATVPIKEGDVFLDLGSGVGQVTLQVAMQCGVKEAIGIELLDTPAGYASVMAEEFTKRMNDGGKTHAPFQLKQGNFLSQEDLPDEMLARADVVFCNNVAFESSLNNSLRERFKVMKNTAKVVSLVSFGNRMLKQKQNQRLGPRRGTKGEILDGCKDGWYFNCDGCGMEGHDVDDGEPMVECFQCGVWQHTACNGVVQSHLPEEWRCKKCSWAGQKQSRQENDFFSVEGPIVCDTAGAVSWTANAVKYYIHTINFDLKKGRYNPAGINGSRMRNPPGVYCICRTRELGNDGMCQCTTCKDWFHFACVGYITGGRHGTNSVGY